MPAMRGPIALLLLASSLLMAGCPASDDITQIDVGLKPTDIVLPLGDVPLEDHGQIVTPEVTVELPPGVECLTNADCDGKVPDLQPCEVATCQGDQCVAEGAPDGSPCNDGNACTVTSCKSGNCIKDSDVDCDDGNACTADICQPDSGCQHTNAVIGCDDGDPCTGPDKCGDGVCKPGKKTCQLGEKENPAKSCKAIKVADPASKDGIYWLEGAPDYQVYCNMTVAGGGWARVALIGNATPVCSYTEGFGNPADLLKNGTTTVIMTGVKASALSFEDKQVLVVVGTLGHYVFKSEHQSWTWAAIAGGTINPTNIGTYNVSGAANYGAF